MTRIALALCGAAAVASALPSTFSVGVPIVVAPTPFIPQNGSGLGFAAASPYIGASGDVWMAVRAGESTTTNRRGARARQHLSAAPAAAASSGVAPVFSLRSLTKAACR